MNKVQCFIGQLLDQGISIRDLEDAAYRARVEYEAGKAAKKSAARDRRWEKSRHVLELMSTRTHMKGD